MKRLCPILLTALLLFAACSGFAEEEEAPSPSLDPDWPVLTEREIVLTVWVDPGAGEEYIRQAAAEFSTYYNRPNITIKCEGVKPSEVVRRVRAGDPPDLFIVPHTEIRQLAQAKLILPARDQVKTKGAVFPACAQAATVGGSIYGYPVSAETTALFYNKQLISEDELPSTWEDLVAFAKGFNDGERYGFVMPVGSAYATAPFITARGNRPFGPYGENEQAVNLETASALEGMAVFQSLRGVIGLSSEELTPGAVEGLFASGRAAICIAGPWSVARFTGAGVDFGVAPLPKYPGEVGSATLAFARVMPVSAYSENPDEASAFAALLLTEDMQKLRLELTGELPSIHLALRSPSYANGFAAQMQYAFAFTSLPAADGFWDSFGGLCARVWDGADMKTELSSLWRAPEPEEDAIE